MITLRKEDTRLDAFLEAIPEVLNGCPSKDFIDECDLFEVAVYLAQQLCLDIPEIKYDAEGNRI